MATTSSNLVAGKALAGQSGDGRNGRYRLKTKVAAVMAVLGCAAALAFGGLKSADRPAPQAQPIPALGNFALVQTQAGNGYLEFSPGDVTTALAVSNVARMQTLTGAGYLEFQPGEGSAVGTSTSNTSLGLREYLDGESPIVFLPLSLPTTQPTPLFGPQP